MLEVPRVWRAFTLVGELSQFPFGHFWITAGAGSGVGEGVEARQLG